MRPTFCGLASPMPANLPSSIRTTARTIATSPFSAAGTCKSSVSMLLQTPAVRLLQEARVQDETLALPLDHVLLTHGCTSSGAVHRRYLH